jgi:hypothetical protein
VEEIWPDHVAADVMRDKQYECQVDIVVRALCVGLGGPISTLLDCHEAEELQELARSSVREEAQVEARRRNGH